jgi:hypothetical protein
MVSGKIQEMKVPKGKPGIPIYIDDSEPKVDDPAHPSEKSYWFPANDITIKLATCLESIRDIQRLLAILAEQDDPSSDKRVVKLMATPLYSFVSGVKDIFNDLQGNAKEYGQLKDVQRQQINSRRSKYLKEVPLKYDGALRTIRDKISSHVDKDIFKEDPRKVWELVKLDLQLKWMRISIDELMFFLSLDVYAWTRESGNHEISRLMLEDGLQVDVNLEEKVIVGTTMARSPKYYISKKVQEVAALYAMIKSKRGYQ